MTSVKEQKKNEIKGFPATVYCGAAKGVSHYSHAEVTDPFVVTKKWSRQCDVAEIRIKQRIWNADVNTARRRLNIIRAEWVSHRNQNGI